MAILRTEFIEDTIKNPNARVQIIADGAGVNVISWLTRPLQFTQLGSTWKAPFEFTQAQGILTNLYNVFARMGGLPQGKMELPAQTIAFWGGSSRPIIIAELMFVSYMKGEDPRQQILQLIKCIAPTTLELTIPILGKVQATYQAPLGYAGGAGRTATSGATGTVQLSIGQWFCARNLLVSSVSPGFSIQTTNENWPLYATATVNFEPYMMPTFNDFCGWFKQPVQAESTPGEIVGKGSREVGKDIVKTPWGGVIPEKWGEVGP